MFGLGSILALLETEVGTFAGKLAAGLIGATVLFGVGFYKGDQHRGAVDGVAGAKAQIEFLQRQIAARDEAAKQAAEQSAADKDRLAQLETTAHEAIKDVTNGVCLDGADADRLRSLWGKPNPKHGKH